MAHKNKRQEARGTSTRGTHEVRPVTYVVTQKRLARLAHRLRTGSPPVAADGVLICLIPQARARGAALDSNHRGSPRAHASLDLLDITEYHSARSYTHTYIHPASHPRWHPHHAVTPTHTYTVSEYVRTFRSARVTRELHTQRRTLTYGGSMVTHRSLRVVLYATHRSLRVVLYAIAILRRFRGGGGLNKELQPLASATTSRLRSVRKRQAS